MSCCNKRKNTAINLLKEEPSFLKDSIKLFKTFDDVNPSELKNQTLNDYHRKIHVLYAFNIKRRPLIKQLINKIINIHNHFAKEIIKRNLDHNSPIEKM